MSDLGRFTTWLSAVERRALERYATTHDLTVAKVIRVAVRQFIGKEGLMSAAQELVGEDEPLVTPVTGSTDGG